MLFILLCLIQLISSWSMYLIIFRILQSLNSFQNFLGPPDPLAGERLSRTTKFSKSFNLPPIMWLFSVGIFEEQLKYFLPQHKVSMCYASDRITDRFDGLRHAAARLFRRAVRAMLSKA